MSEDEEQFSMVLEAPDGEPMVTYCGKDLAVIYDALRFARDNFLDENGLQFSNEEIAILQNVIDTIAEWAGPKAAKIMVIEGRLFEAGVARDDYFLDETQLVPWLNTFMPSTQDERRVRITVEILPTDLRRRAATPKKRPLFQLPAVSPRGGPPRTWEGSYATN